MLRISGKIDRIDRRPDGMLSLRDYKTGRAPSAEVAGSRLSYQLQLLFYLLAAERIVPGAVVSDAFLDFVDPGRRINFDPADLKGAPLRARLKAVVDAIAQGHFVQEPSACEWCDFTPVCGPQPLLARRRQIKSSDKRILRVLQLRDAR
jgi:putative RecB family exonuclease